MVQIRVGDIYLDLYEFDPPKLNFAIEDITDTSTKSSFSKEFRVPATAKNSEFFTTAFDINGQDFDITQKIDAELMVDGILFKEGELRLNEIYITRENERIDYGCLFFGETRSFASSVGLGVLTDLDLSEYNHDLVYTALTKSWEVYPSGTTTDGLFDGDILYPLIDHGNTYDGTTVEQARISPLGTHNFTQGGGSYDVLKNLEQSRFKPMVRVKAIWDKIFEEAGYSYTSDFITGDTFSSLYLSAFGNEAGVYATESSNNMIADGSGEVTSVSPTVFDLDFVELDPGGNVDLTNNWYLVPQTGGYAFSYNIYFEAINVPPVTFCSVTVDIRKTTGGVTTTLKTTTVSTISNPDGEAIINIADEIQGLSLTVGDKIFIEYQGSHFFSSAGSFNCDQSIGQINLNGLLDEKYRKIDFLKDIITKFRLVLAPDATTSNNFIIEPWATYIGTGDILDWTDKLDVSKDFKISPLFYTQKSQIEFIDSEAGDFLNTLYQNQYDEPFGTLRVISNNILLEGEREIKTNLYPCPVTQIEEAFVGNNGMNNTIIPQLHTHSAEDGVVKHIPVLNNRVLLFYNGMKNTGTDASKNKTWYIIDDLGTGIGRTNYPMVSHFSEFPVVGGTIDLNWQREEGYIQFGLHSQNVGSSVYDLYWSNYINSLYDKFARRVTAYFVLNSQDLIDFSFDDVIFVKDTYYYVEKIYDVPLGEKASVKVDLIKLLNR